MTTITDLKSQYEASELNDLITLKKKLYAKVDITAPISSTEKLLNEVIAGKHSEVFQRIREKRNAAKK